MTHYWYYIECGRFLDDTAHIYKVGLGESLQGSRDRFWLAAYAAGHGHYFQPCSMESSNFIRRVLMSLLRPLAAPAACKGRALVRLLKAGEAMPSAQAALDAAHQQHTQLSLDYRCAAAIALRAQRHCPCPPTLKT